MADPTGVHILTLPDEAAKVARDWLDEHGQDAMLPPYYAPNNALTRHIYLAVGSLSDFLSSRHHTNRVTHEEFSGIVYLADGAAVKPYTTAVQGTHVVVIGVQWVFQLVKICDRLTGALSQRPRTGPPSDHVLETLVDVKLSQLLVGGLPVSEAEAVQIADSWPLAPYTEDDLGPWAVFYDLVRLVWLHELAHALCGHLAFVRDHLALMALHSSTPDGEFRGTQLPVDGPTAEIQQCLEMHADEFAVRSLLGEILYGVDPVALMLYTNTDLGDRLLHLNTAFCVYAVLWELDEKKPTATSTGWADRSHPPVDLRYDRFRNFQREAAIDYDERLGTVVDGLTLEFLDILCQASPLFSDLYRLTPFVVRTPSMDEAERYEQHLMRLMPSIAKCLTEQAYLPTERLNPKTTGPA
jgi:hypothetical protein